MDINGKRVLIFGGWGLVGQAIAKQLLEEQPSELVVTSLRENEALEIQTILENHPLNRGTKPFACYCSCQILPEAARLTNLLLRACIHWPLVPPFAVIWSQHLFALLPF